jgi:hypothetical protein
MFHKFIWLLILSLLCGCATYKHEMGKPIDQGKANQIIEGKTTETEVISLLGEPQNTIIRPDGSKVIGYSYNKFEMYGSPGFARSKGGMSGESLMLLIKNGLVAKKMESSRNMPTKTTLGETLSVPDKYK